MRVDQVRGIFHCLACGYKGSLFRLFNEESDRVSIARESLKTKIKEIRAASVGLRIPRNAEFLEEDFRVSADTLKDFEAFRSLDDDFRHRVVFPIRDIKDKIVCFVGRAEEDYTGKAKYKVSPSGAKVPLFPLHKLQPEKGRVMLVEGLFDLLNLYQHGFQNVLCAFGTSTVNKDKLSILTILGVTGIDICFDGDDAGRAAAEEVRNLCESQNFQVKVINLPNCDPGDLPKEKVLRLKEKLYG
jgi:DNA primase